MYAFKISIDLENFSNNINKNTFIEKLQWHIFRFTFSVFTACESSFPLEEFIYNYLITLSFYIIPKKGV